jgi:hypothetical protein
MSEADFLVKLRDGAIMMSDAAQERLEKLAPVGGAKWTPDKITWTKAEGTSGPYEKSEDVNSLDFKELLKDLVAHNGKLYHDGYFYWRFQSGSVAGRKLKKK